MPPKMSLNTPPKMSLLYEQFARIIYFRTVYITYKGESLLTKSGDWQCKVGACGCNNFAARTACYRCGAKRPSF